MSAIGPGDWVECVNNGPCPVHGKSGLTTGAIYCVSHVEDEETLFSGVALWLVRVRSSGPRGGFCASRFRPIYRPKADFIEGLLKPIEAPTEPEKVSA